MTFREHTLTDLLAAFFYEKGYVSVPRLGTLQGGAASAPGGGPGAGNLSFAFNPNQPEDPELVDFITEHTRKMRPLAVSDLNSLSDQAREMLNMGQSFTLRSLATLIPDGHGGFNAAPDNSPFLVSLKEKNPPAFNTTRKPPFREGRIHSTGNRRTLAGVLMTTISICLGGLLVYFLFFHQEVRPDQSLVTPPVPSGVREDRAGPSPGDGLLHYEAVFEHASGERALRRYRQLTAWGHPIIMHTHDSVHYSLAIRFATPAADTANVKDSISRLYGHPVEIRILP